MNLDAIAGRAIVFDGEFFPTSGKAILADPYVYAYIPLENGARLLLSFDIEAGEGVAWLQYDASSQLETTILPAYIENGKVVAKGEAEPYQERIRQTSDLRLAILMLGQMAVEHDKG